MYIYTTYTHPLRLFWTCPYRQIHTNTQRMYVCTHARMCTLTHTHTHPPLSAFLCGFWSLDCVRGDQGVGCYVSDSSKDTFRHKSRKLQQLLPSCDNECLCLKQCQKEENTCWQLHHVIRENLRYLIINVYVVLIATFLFSGYFDSGSS